MERNWVAIGAIVVVAAAIGWLVVGLVGRAPEAPAPGASAPRPDAAGAISVERAAAGRATAGTDDAEDGIERDLAALAQALRLDETIETRVLPPAIVGIGIPLTIDYRRPVRFWQPAFAAAAKAAP